MGIISEGKSGGYKPLWQKYRKELMLEKTGIIVKPSPAMSVRNCLEDGVLCIQGRDFWSNIFKITPPVIGGELIRCTIKQGGKYTDLLYSFFMAAWRDRAYKESVPIPELGYDLEARGMVLNLYRLDRLFREDHAGEINAQLNHVGGENHFLVHSGYTDPHVSPVCFVTISRATANPLTYAVESEPLQGAMGTISNEGDTLYFTAPPEVESFL